MDFFANRRDKFDCKYLWFSSEFVRGIQGRLKPKFYCVHLPFSAISYCVWRLIYCGGALFTVVAPSAPVCLEHVEHASSRPWGYMYSFERFFSQLFTHNYKILMQPTVFIPYSKLYNKIRKKPKIFYFGGPELKSLKYAQVEKM